MRSLLRPSLVIARYTLLEAVRNRLLWLVLAFLIAAVGLAEFVGEVAVTESGQIRSGVLGTLLRLCSVLVVALFVITSVVRELNDKGLELVLALPVPRASYHLGKLLGFSSVALVTAASCGAGLALYVPVGQAGLWAASLLCELLVVIAFALLCLYTFNQVTVAFSTVLAFYVLSRAIAAIQLMGHDPIAGAHSPSHRVIVWLVDGLAFVLPELHRFTSSQWLVYHSGVPADLGPVAGQTIVYLALLTGAALFDLYRREP